MPDIQHRRVHQITLDQRNKDTLFLCIGDTHYGKVTDSYNEEVLADALFHFFDRALDIIVRYETPPDVYVVFLGDIVDGQHIYPQQVFSTEPADPLQQAQEFVDLLEHTLDLTWGNMFRINGFIPVIGNHGRVSKFHPVTTSWDRVVYSQLAVKGFLGKNEVGIDYAQFVEVTMKLGKAGNEKERKLLIHHGHTIRTRGRVPYYAMEDKLLRWQQNLGRFFDYAVMGHFHTSALITVGRAQMYLNGTSVMGDDYVFQGGWTEGRNWWILEFDREGKMNRTLVEL